MLGAVRQNAARSDTPKPADRVRLVRDDQIGFPLLEGGRELLVGKLRIGDHLKPRAPFHKHRPSYEVWLLPMLSVVVPIEAQRFAHVGLISRIAVLQSRITRGSNSQISSLPWPTPIAPTIPFRVAASVNACA